LHDIVDDSRRTGRGSEGLVVAIGIQGEFADQGAVLGHNAHVLVGDEEDHALALVGLADPDVAEAAEVAEGDAARFVHLVVPDTELRWFLWCWWVSLDPRVEGEQRRLQLPSTVED
jgi:hypothetical protein